MLLDLPGRYLCFFNNFPERSALDYKQIIPVYLEEILMLLEIDFELTGPPFHGGDKKGGINLMPFLTRFYLGLFLGDVNKILRT